VGRRRRLAEAYLEWLAGAREQSLSTLRERERALTAVRPITSTRREAALGRHETVDRPVGRNAGVVSASRLIGTDPNPCSPAQYR